jgi:hypothetical protein
MALCKLRTALKNRIHSTLAKNGITTTEHNDTFAGECRIGLSASSEDLPRRRGAVSPRRLNH